MAKKIDLHLFDERVVERNIANGLITREDHAAFLAKLPDDSENLTYTVIEDDEEDEDDLLDDDDLDDEDDEDDLLDDEEDEDE